MQKLILYRLAGLALSITLSACGDAADKGENGSSNANNGNPSADYTIVYPNGWDQLDDFGGSDTAARSQRENDGDTFLENINVVLEELDVTMTPTEYYTASVVRMETAFENFEEVRSQTISLPSGQPAYELVYRHELQGTSLQVKAIFLTHAKVGYVITCTALHETFDRWEPQFDEVIESFVITDGIARP